MKGKRKNFTLHLLCWSHLDREWDFPFEQTRAEFLELLDDTATILETRSEYRAFHLDGQVRPLEDYLELRPEERPRFARLVKSGRLLIGPWYTLPEMNVISGECIVRNLLWGRAFAAPFGGVMNVGFTNSGWGQISQMPQILRNFGLDVYTSYRGVPVEEIEKECLWEGADGSRVILMRPAKGGRSAFFLNLMLPATRYRFRDPRAEGMPGAFPPAAREAAADEPTSAPYFAEHDPERLHLEDVAGKMRRIINNLLADATTSHLWLGNWQDRRHPHPKLLEATTAARKSLPPGMRLRFSSLPEYVAAVKKERRNLKVQLRGELRSPQKGAEGAELLNVLSARTYVKVANRRAEFALLYGAEPWAAAAAALGMKPPVALLDRAWKLLLLNHCHDTIGGVGVDRVHEDQMNRYSRITDLAAAVRRRALTYLVRRIAAADDAGAAGTLTVFNSLPHSRSTVVECSLDVPQKGAFAGVSVFDSTGRPVECEVLRSRKVRTKVYAPFDSYQMRGVRRFRVRLRLENLSPFGWESFSVVPTRRRQSAGEPLPCGDDRMENEYLRVRFLPDGSFDLADKRTGLVFKRCGRYEDGGDVGNGWGYEPPARDKTTTSAGHRAKIRLMENGRLQTTFRVETTLTVPATANRARAARSARRVSLPLQTDLTLKKDDPRLYVETVVVNRAKDHRLRVLFPTVPGAKYSWADTPFDVVRRPVGCLNSSAWREQDRGARPMLNFVDVGNGRRGLAIFTEGLCEYEAAADSVRTLALTLLRAYGFRHPRWENCVAPEVPGSQCLGEHVFRYVLYPHAGDWEQAELPRVAGEALLPPLPMQHFASAGPLPRRCGFLRVGSAEIVLHAVKRSEDGKALVVRLGNPTSKKITSKLACFLPLRRAVLCNMAEEPLKVLAVRRDGCIRLELGSKKVLSLYLETKVDSAFFSLAKNDGVE